MRQNVVVVFDLFTIGFSFATPFIFTGQRFNTDFLPALTPTCLGCICEASTNCNLTIGCTERFCGPFFISETYWKEAGSPIIQTITTTTTTTTTKERGAFEACVNDPQCAATTLKQYVGRYAQDCNRNLILDCDDYARIHYLGGRQCYLPIKHYNYYSIFRNCHTAVQILN